MPSARRLSAGCRRVGVKRRSRWVCRTEIEITVPVILDEFLVEVDAEKIADAIVLACGIALMDWERKTDSASPALDSLAGWRDEDGNRVPAKS